MSLERHLRISTLLATAIAFPLDLATTIISINEEKNNYYSGRSITTFSFGFIPLAMTVVASFTSLQHTKKHGKVSDALHIRMLDLVAVLAYISVLVPIWVIEIGRLEKSGFALLAGYTTAPMIVNL